MAFCIVSQHLYPLSINLLIKPSLDKKNDEWVRLKVKITINEIKFQVEIYLEMAAVS